LPQRQLDLFGRMGQQHVRQRRVGERGHARLAVEPDDRGISVVERADHHGDRPAGQRVPGGLVAAAGIVEKGDPVWIEDVQRNAAARRDVDRPFVVIYRSG